MLVWGESAIRCISCYVAAAKKEEGQTQEAKPVQVRTSRYVCLVVAKLPMTDMITDRTTSHTDGAVKKKRRKKQQPPATIQGSIHGRFRAALKQEVCRQPIRQFGDLWPQVSWAHEPTRQMEWEGYNALYLAREAEHERLRIRHQVPEKVTESWKKEAQTGSVFGRKNKTLMVISMLMGPRAFQTT